LSSGVLRRSMQGASFSCNCLRRSMSVLLHGEYEDTLSYPSVRSFRCLDRQHSNGVFFGGGFPVTLITIRSSGRPSRERKSLVKITTQTPAPPELSSHLGLYSVSQCIMFISCWHTPRINLFGSLSYLTLMTYAGSVYWSWEIWNGMEILQKISI